MARNVVVLINRTSKRLQYVFDGSVEILEPGENYGIPFSHVQIAKDQLKQMGSEEFYNPTKFVCLIAVKGSKDPCEPIEQTDDLQIINRKEVDAQTGRESESRRANGPTVFDARMPGAMEPSAQFAAPAGDGRPAGAATPRTSARARQAPARPAARRRASR